MTKKAGKLARLEPEPAASQFASEFAPPEVVKPKPQVTLGPTSFITSNYVLDLAFISFMNNLGGREGDFCAGRGAGRGYRVGAGRPPMQLGEEFQRQEALFGGDEGRLMGEHRPIIGNSGLSGVVPEGNYQPTPSGGLQTLSGDFVCVTCKRGPPHTKKYAKNQCQTCYKKTKKAQRFEDGMFMGSVFLGSQNGYGESSRGDFSGMRR